MVNPTQKNRLKTLIIKGLRFFKSLTRLLTRHRIRLFTTGFIQVYFVSINTVFLSAGYIAGVAVASFLISYLWTLNVKSVAFGSKADRFTYSIGATLGGLCGLLTTKLFTL